MMDFDNILDIASQNQGVSGAQKRYSLQAGPPKKDPRSKGVNPAAVQALIKKRCVEAKQKELKSKKQKEDLIAKRVELKSDRKARAMASRTKDNFKGYNGVPVVEVPKKRRTKEEMRQRNLCDAEGFRNDSIDPEDDEDNYEYEQTDSESEQEPQPLKPGRTMGGSSCSNSTLPSKKHSGPPKSAPPPLNFADLLKLAEKKQHEPVDLKPKKVKTDERLRTADELRELEMERKAKRPDRDRDSKQERERDSKSQSSSRLVKKSTLVKEQRNIKMQKNSLEKTNFPSGSEKKSLPHSKSSVQDRERTKTSQSERDRFNDSGPSFSVNMHSKIPSKATSSQVSTKQAGMKPSYSHKPSTSSDLSSKRDNASLPSKRPLGMPGMKPSGTGGTNQKSQHGSSQQPGLSSLRQGPAGGAHKGGKGEPVRSGVNTPYKSSGNSVVRPNSGGPPKVGSQTQARQTKPGGLPQTKAGGSGLHGHPGGSGPRPQGVGPGRPGSGAMGSGRPAGSMASGRPGGSMASGRPGGSMASGRPGGTMTSVRPGGTMASVQPGGSMGSGPGRPKCTVVSETISSKNVGGPRPRVPIRPGMPQRPGMAPRPGMLGRPGMPPRPMMNRPPVPMLPPITSVYKRKYEDEEDEFDPEMDDFIDDGGEEQEEISKHIREIFGYDRSRYKNESDYALKFMESSWKDTQKEEARSLRMAVEEDLEEERREVEEMKKKTTKRRKN